jgi:hypothetical protein
VCMPISLGWNSNLCEETKPYFASPASPASASAPASVCGEWAFQGATRNAKIQPARPPEDTETKRKQWSPCSLQISPEVPSQ